MSTHNERGHPMIDHRFLKFVNYRRSLPQRQRDLLDGLTRKLLAAGPAAPLSLARETWWRWIQRALPRATPAECQAMAYYAMAAVASGIISLAGQARATMQHLATLRSQLAPHGSHELPTGQLESYNTIDKALSDYLSRITNALEALAAQTNQQDQVGYPVSQSSIETWP